MKPRSSPIEANYPVSAFLVDDQFKNATGDLNPRCIGDMARCKTMAALFREGRERQDTAMEGPDLGRSLGEALDLVQLISPSKLGRGRDDVVEMNKQRQDDRKATEALQSPAAPE